MKIQLEKKAFAQAMALAHSASLHDGSRIPEFERLVELEAGETGLTISAYDGRCHLAVTVAGETMEAGKVSLQTGGLRDCLARARKGEMVEFSTVNKESARRSRGEIVTETALHAVVTDSEIVTDLGRPTGPEIPAALIDEGEAKRFDIPAPDLLAMLNETLFAASHECTRYYLNGVFVTVHEGRLRMVATDGHRLALRDSEIPITPEDLPEHGNNHDRGFILPNKAAGFLARLLKGQAGPVAVAVSQKAVCFEFDGVSIRTKPIDGVFPDFARVMPDGDMKECPIDLQAIGERVRKVRPDRRGNGFVLLNGATVLRYRKSFEAEWSEMTLPQEAAIEGEPIGFNAWYVADIAAAFGKAAAGATIAYRDHIAPALFTAESRPDLRIVQMPYKV